MKTVSSILVVEDNPIALKTLATLLSALGVETVREAGSAEKALKIVKKEKFSIILTDYRLIGMSGVQFIERLRSSGNQTPVIVLSGAPDRTGVMRAATYNRVDFFGKPLQKRKYSTGTECVTIA